METCSSLVRNAFSGECTTTSTLLWIALLVGSLHLACWAWQSAAFFFRFVLPGANLKRYGAWAVVTGATDGIGKGYAFELARKGLNVVLISRSEENLKAVAEELKAKYPKVEVATIAADFSKGADGKLYEEIAIKLTPLDIGILVNNVGASYPHAEYFHELPTSLVDHLIQLNVVSTTRMTHIVLPKMVEKKRGAIINVASAAGVIKIGDPLYAVYSATKAYVDFFSKSLHYELRTKGVDVSCHVPWFVTSKLSKIRHTSLTVPSPTGYARAAVAMIGRGASVVPFWSHAIEQAVANALPTPVLAWGVLKHHFGIRSKALKKKQEQAKQ